MKSFRDLNVWQKAHELVLKVYEITKRFPDEERYGLTSQLRRSVISIPANIVEGFKRRGMKEFARFLNFSDASLEETKYHILLSRDLHYISNTTFLELTDKCEEIGKMLSGLQKKLHS